MSTLRQALALNRATETDDPHLCYSTKAEAPSLVVQTGHGVRWVLPWMHFIHGHHSFHDDREQFMLIFVSHEVTIHGQNLGLLADDAAALRLDKIWSLSRDYRGVTTEPFIENILVRACDDQPPNSDESAD